MTTKNRVRILAGVGRKGVHGLQDEAQVVQEGIDGHAQDPSFVGAPLPEKVTKRK